MKTVALISGGKDSCFNMMKCVAEGHQIVALANLKPLDQDELDSYMYQTVGHQAIDLYAEAMGLPLFRQTIKGTALGIGRDYLPQEADEVEDLYELLQRVKNELEIEAVAVGAILSDYQRVRVENVCLRLGITPLAYLWRCQQAPLLQEMVDCGVEAIIIKVAALGLNPDHLGLTLREILPHMQHMERKYGLNVCGEGGEYETFTLDCPLFYNKIVIDEKEIVIHSADAFAPVGYLRFHKFHLVDKSDHRSQAERVQGLSLTTSQTLLTRLKQEQKDACLDDDTYLSEPALPTSSVIESLQHCVADTGTYFCLGCITAYTDLSLAESAGRALDVLRDEVEKLGAQLSDVFSVCLHVKKMSDFAAINAVYKTYFSINPPVRVCVQACLPDNVLFQLDCQGQKMSAQVRRTMHVQGVSHWAPANIGPYSQATVVDGKVYVAGQIPLVAGSMTLATGGIRMQSCLSLQHVSSILDAMCPGTTVLNVLLAVCYVVHHDFIAAAKQQWQLVCTMKAELQRAKLGTCEEYRPLMQYVVLPALPRDASIEWQVYSTSSPVSITETEEEIRQDGVWVQSRGLTSTDNPNVFSAETNVFLQSKHENLDCSKVVSACLRCYRTLMTRLRKDWSDVPLLRVFFCVDIFSYQHVYNAFQKELQDSGSFSAFSLVPALRLADPSQCLALCH
ncbi:diphthine--ammonia ligase-like isoform X2 [Pomacea canaliculata]|nr:diphthine--ammonia ligase-like isoform X2 [Pomacea canaliculata]